MDPEVSSHPEKTAASQGTRSQTTKSSQGTDSAIPESSGGSWSPCTLDEETLSLIEQEGLVAAKEISKWWVIPSAAMPAPRKREIVMLKSHIDQGLSLPPSYFLKSMLRHYQLQLHRIAPNSMTIVAGFVVVCEG
jgi:hypothetical protein